MGLNVKVSLVICLVFIASMSWMVHQVNPPMVALPSPLIASGMTLPELRAAAALAAATPVEQRDVAPSVAGSFKRENAFEAQATENLRAGGALAIAHPEPLEATPARRALPPLVQTTILDEPPALAANTAESAGGNPPDPRLTLMALTDPNASSLPLNAAAALSAPPRGASRYRVQRGDSLVKIARREYDTDDEHAVQLIVDANPQLRGRPDRILVDQELIIPDLGTARSETATLAEPVPQQSQPRWYTIQKCDSLTRIAERHLNDGRRWREIARLNRIADANKIIPGRRIKLPPITALVRG
ncbi:MAG: LysM peptidoglycan-binding domain-containing protein [Planctomycetes bacterium]|nr:LysM peptidoglycan-binding domain-containing protein [Planctomycetota bacterium]